MPRHLLKELRASARVLRRHSDGHVRHWMAVALGLMALSAMLTSLTPLALKLVVDALEERSSTHYATTLVFAYATCLLVTKLLADVRTYVYALSERRMFRRLAQATSDTLMQATLRFHLGRRTGAIQQALDAGLQGYQRIMHQLAYTVVPTVIELATALAVLLSLHEPVFLIIFVVAAICHAGTVALFSRTLAAHTGRALSSDADAMAMMTDTILCYETIKFFSAERYVASRADAVHAQSEMRWLGFHRQYLLGTLGTTLVHSLFVVLTTWLSARLVVADTLTIGGFILVNTYVIQLSRAVEILGISMRVTVQGLSMFKGLRDLLEAPAEPSDEHHARPPSVIAGAIDVRHVSFGYDPDRPVLRDLNLHVPAGRVLAIVGVSGSGKSTIVRLLARLITPDAGHILLDGKPIAEWPSFAIREMLAVVPQDISLLNGTIAANIGIGREGCTAEDIRYAAEEAGLAEFINALPQGYETIVGERGTRLSGGERQRVAIARAIARKPLIYIFDEATSSLDNVTERQILGRMRYVSRHATTIIIAHRLSTVVHADNIVLLEDGRIVEEGTHHTLLRSQGRYAALWKAQITSVMEAV